MHYKVKTAWIFVLLVLSIVSMILFPNNWTIGIGTVVVPVVIFYQTWLILKADDKSEHTFSEDGKWYEDR
jgi:4-hydroxybenzoate polyprenyltransferase